MAKETAEELAKAKAEALAASEAEAEKVTSENGIVKISEKTYNQLLGIQSDLGSIKERAKKAEALVEKQAAAQKAAEEKALLEKQEFKTLYEKEKTERENVNTKLKDNQITSALTVAALEAGISKGDYVRLIDKSTVQINADTGEISGVKEIVAKFKTDNPELFKKPGVDNTHVEDGVGGRPTGLLTDAQVLEMKAKQIMHAKLNDPALYARWQKLATHNGGQNTSG